MSSRRVGLARPMLDLLADPRELRRRRRGQQDQVNVLVERGGDSCGFRQAA
ncbi:MAG: hypothetical protein ACRDGH_14630 [Candidatus Limnocylindria bacterium]